MKVKTRALAFVALLVALTLVFFASRGHHPAAGDPITYADAESPGLPARQPVLLRMLDARDTTGMRRHAWTVWAAMTRPTSAGFPRYLTWYRVCETFGPGELAAQRGFAPEFRIPSQKNLGSGDAILSLNLYNDSFRYHVRRNGYQSKQKLMAMAKSFTDVVEFPKNDAISVKTVWWPVRRDGLTAFPVWDDMPTRPITWGRGDEALIKMGAFKDLSRAEQAAMKTREEQGNDFESFARVVAVDSRRSRIPKDETAEVTFFDPQDAKMQRIITRRARVVPMSNMFTVQVNDPKLVEWINNLPLSDELTVRMWGRKFEVGDYVALVASHVSTREIPDWVWFTMYWHDEPDQAPLGSDRTAQVPGVFRNYKMHSVFHAELPKEADGHNAIAFNPYLEAAFAYGPKSNCAACHQRAVMTPEGPGEVFPVHLGYMPKDHPYFKGKLRLDNFLVAGVPDEVMCHSPILVRASAP